jgi:phosphopantothenoylcysteine synthetase/decarboxylase
MMKLLITAGNTQTPIDQVRCITNIFTGKTGAQIALEASRRGHEVTLLTSHPDALPDLTTPRPGCRIVPYRTFDDLRDLMASELQSMHHDVLIHAAAVSDYELAGVYIPEKEKTFDPKDGTWAKGAALQSVTAGKVKSHHAELWMRLTPTIKLADQVRKAWGFQGTFVKFKLEVGLTDAQLILIANQSRAQSDADYIVANTLEGKNEVAFLGDRSGRFEQIHRPHLAAKLLERIELTEKSA